jgi:hypothetical protein
MLTNLIPSLGQIGDTIKCYNAEELRHIATALISGKQCREEYQLSLVEISILNNIIDKQTIVIENCDSIIKDQKQLILNRENQIDDLKGQVKKEKRKHTWTKVKYAITSTLLAAGMIYFILQ